MVSYPSQEALLQWLPINKRCRLVQLVPSLKGLHRRLPIRVDVLDLRSPYRIELDGYAFDLEVQGSVKSITVVRIDGAEVEAKEVVRVKENTLTTHDFQMIVFAWLQKTARFVGALKLGADLFSEKTFYENALMSKIRHVETYGFFSPHMASIVRYGRHRHFMDEAKLELRPFITTFEQRQPPIGTELELHVDFNAVLEYTDNGHPWSKQVAYVYKGAPERGDTFQRPSFGLVPFNDAWLRAKSRRPDLVDIIRCDNVDMHPCLVFALPHADLAVFMLRTAEVHVSKMWYLVEKDVIFRVVPKKSIHVFKGTLPASVKSINLYTMENYGEYPTPDRNSRGFHDRTAFQLVYGSDALVLRQAPTGRPSRYPPLEDVDFESSESTLSVKATRAMKR